MTDPYIIEIIRAMDPDGNSFREPVADDYRRFKANVIAFYGEQAWNDYNKPAKGQGTYE
jgi:hypothetical protein